MKISQWLTAILLLLLVGAAIVGIVETRPLPAPAADETAATPERKTLGHKTTVAPRPLVDQRPLETARRMAATAGTPEEQTLAKEAEKVGDHEVDLSFFDALRTAEENPPPLSPEAKQIADRKAKAEQTVNED